MDILREREEICGPDRCTELINEKTETEVGSCLMLSWTRRDFKIL